MIRVHATCVALPDPADPASWAGVLIRGPSGAGKSDLALRLIDSGARLVADDQTELRQENGRICAQCPPALSGLIEMRGAGLVRLSPIRQAFLALIVDPVVDIDAAARLPEPRTEEAYGAPVPVIATQYAAASAPARVRLALAATRLGLFAPATTRLDAGRAEESESGG